MTLLPDRTLPWPICWDGVVLISTAEDCRLKAYRCPAGIWTDGWGETDGVGPTTVWTQAFADQRLCDSLTERVHAVRDACTVAPTDNQLAALVSFAYNCKGWEKSSVIKAHNRGDAQSASRAFGLWNKARVGGQLVELAGLTSRRAAEAALYLKPEAEEAAHPMPQAVAAESSVAASPIAQGGAVTGAAGALAIVSQAGDQVQTVSSTVAVTKGFVVDTLGIPANWFLPLVMVGAGAAVVWWRLKQRRAGWV